MLCPPGMYWLLSLPVPIFPKEELMDSWILTASNTDEAPPALV